jgi:hypothetical protein
MIHCKCHFPAFWESERVSDPWRIVSDVGVDPETILRRAEASRKYIDEASEATELDE